MYLFIFPSSVSRDSIAYLIIACLDDSGLTV